MNDNPTRGLLIAILVVATLNLIATGILTAVTPRSASGTPAVVAEGAQSLPKKYTAAVLAEIASRVVAPYNLQEADAFYNAFDDIAKNQIPREKFDKQLAELVHLVGKVESSSFSGSQKQQQTQGRLDMYTLNYVVRLSGTNLQTGVMSISIVDREPEAGIVGFFISGRTQQ